jgi:DNA-binding response OmpR family regulator
MPLSSPARARLRINGCAPSRARRLLGLGRLCREPSAALWFGTLILPKRILVVEDDATIRDTLVFNLKKEGYVVTVAQDGAEALTRSRESHPDMVLLDLMLPELNGLEVCRLLRQESSVPIIMLTAKESEVDKVVGLQLGADDYITKPFSLRELFARMTAVFRRTEQRDVRPEVEEDRMGRLRVDRAGRRAMIDGTELRLTPKEWELLAYLVRRPGRVFTREILLEQVWGYNYLGDRKTVDVHIRWLREKLGRFGKLGFEIVTVRGAGYRLDPVREASPEAPAAQSS